ncbi:MAG: hypothetical protein AB8B51_16415, partial [Sedimentitalea sp.]
LPAVPAPVPAMAGLWTFICCANAGRNGRAEVFLCRGAGAGASLARRRVSQINRRLGIGA